MLSGVLDVTKSLWNVLLTTKPSCDLYFIHKLLAVVTALMTEVFRI